MNPAEQYRKKAAEFRSKAARASTQHLAAQWDNLAKCYTRLAAQADRNSVQDLWFEFGPKLRRGQGGEA